MDTSAYSFALGAHYSLQLNLTGLANKVAELNNHPGNEKEFNKYEKKGALIGSALEALIQSGHPSIKQGSDGQFYVEIEIFKLSEDDYTLTTEKTLKYGNDVLKYRNTIGNKAGFYDQNNDETYTNFSNSNYGGGVFSGGFAMEEILLIETPNALAIKVPECLPNDLPPDTQKLINSPKFFTSRVGPNEDPKETQKVLAGFPCPFLLKGCLRVQKVHKNYYNNRVFQDATKDELVNTLEKFAPRPYNTLVIAAPNLGSYWPFADKYPKPFLLKLGEEGYDLYMSWLNSKTITVDGQEYKGVLSYQTTVEVCTDLFNTLVAGANAALQAGIIHSNSGKLGTGAFKNKLVVSYMMHRFASDYTGIKYTVWDTNDDEAAKFNAIWEDIRPHLEGKTITQGIKFISDYLTAQ